MGMGVVEVERTPQGLKPVMGRYNRRITVDTPFTLTGPAAGTDFVKTTGRPDRSHRGRHHGQLLRRRNPLGHRAFRRGELQHVLRRRRGRTRSPTPWTPTGSTATASPLKPSELLWETFDPRFDLAKTPNEINRFGYVVELNPWDPNSTPVKHTALGRFKHEGANVYVTDDGTVVAYSGDDERFDYMYKFVSSKKIQPGWEKDPAAMANNMTILDEGTLYVAKLSSDIPAGEIDGSGKLPAEGSFSGSGTWLPLLRSGPGGQAESLVPGRDRAGGRGVHPIRRRQGGRHQDGPARGLRGQPEDRQGLRRADQQRRPRRGGRSGTRRRQPTQRQQERPDPRDHRQPRGHRLHLGPAAGLRGSRPRPTPTSRGFDKTKVSPISCPDNVAFDSHGNLWISTDGNALDSNDGLFAVALEGPNRGETKQFLTVPLGAETCGPIVTDDLVTVVRAASGRERREQHRRPALAAGPRAATERRARRWSRCGRPTGTSASDARGIRSRPTGIPAAERT